MIASMQHTEFSGLAGAASSPPHFEQSEFYAIAAGGSCEQACTVATRHALDEKLLNLLAHRAEPEVAYALAYNPHARLGRKILRCLMERGREDPVLARALLRRDDLHLCHLRLFLHADAEERGHLIAVARLSGLATIRRGESYPEPGAAKLSRLENCALDKRPEAFRQALADSLRCDLPMARRIADDKGGEALALALVAIGLSCENIARIFLAAYPDIRDSRPKFRAIMRIVESVPRRAAARMIRIIIGEPATIHSRDERAVARAHAESLRPRPGP